ncbi:hypothetical protein pdam_00011307 [Pocillopora damicornis]|uniref:Zinc finger protein 706 n=1 Tax=Pocillopora damicornis TaxID=46731 RepID=A0A3M6TR90_POCDA|nr:hypothetical protein pdam_00011307 [Pocillopora damicornis]
MILDEDTSESHFYEAFLVGSLERSLDTVTSFIRIDEERRKFEMARGHQKFQSQQKNAQKQEKLKKAQGHDQKSAALKALVFTCTVCKSQMPDPKTYKQHFESKHPKAALPPELASA